MRAQGISLARSPHHADLVLITGALSEAAREPLQRVLAGVPQPRALVAVGDCAIDGCVFRGSPSLSTSAAETLDVNVEIAGCPPSPQAILDAITEAAQLLYREEEGEDGEDDIAEDEETEEVEETGELAGPDEGELDADAAANGPQASQSMANGRGGA
jgi:Ni,Fe-hydrogenase III small subunit